jgi:RND family efflux transporter MFP subunit
MERGEETVLNLARSLMTASDLADLLRQLASAAREAIGADWAGVWIYERRGKSYSLEHSLPDGAFSPVVKRAGRRGDLLAEAVARKGLVVRRGEEIDEPMLEHLDAAGRPPVREVFCVPFTLESDRLGLLELVRESPSAPEEHLGQARFLSACASLASSAAVSIVQARAGRESQLAAINRLMQLYDVSQVFHATLERDALLPVIADRVGLILDAPLCRIWLPAEEGEGLERAFPEGDGETGRLEPRAGVPWTAFQSGESVLVSDVAKPEAAESIGEFYAAGEAGSVICAPLVVDESCLGAVEVVRPPGAAPFGEDDRDFLEELSRQAAIALRNSNLLLAERKAHELGALLDISREITSTLDLDRVLLTVVNRADSIVPCERCAILLGEGRAMELRAVSGYLEVDRKDPRLRDLEEILSWACLGGQGLYVSELDGRIETDREETREKFRRYFERAGLKTFVAFPLKDEEGLLGMLSVESGQPYFVSEDKLEVLNILANQATVAIRNASLYRQIPLINVMQPIAGWRSRLRKVPRWKWLRNAGIAAGIAAVLVLVPWNMKIAGKVVILPAKNSTVTTEIEGIVDAVYRREGDRVRKGDPLAALLERDYRIRMEEARARYAIADREVAEREAGLDRAAARQARIRRDQFREELELLRQELEKTRIAAPVDGVILTPRLEQKVGTLLRKGEEFCRIADMREVAVEVLVPETEVAEIAEGQRVRLKMDSFPTETFIGRVEIVGQKVIEEGGGRFLIVRGRLDGGDRPLKAGMLGRSKIEVGRRALGYVLLRKPARFLWRTLWRWLP